MESGGIETLLPVDCVLALQRTAGNAVVTRYLEARLTRPPIARQERRGRGRRRQASAPAPAIVPSLAVNRQYSIQGRRCLCLAPTSP